MKTVGKLASFIDQELKSNLRGLVITYANNRYELFGRFRIDISDQMFKVTDAKTKDKTEMTSLKNAVLYCTLANAGKYVESRRLESLDLKLSSLQVDIAIHRKMLKVADTDQSRCIYTTKLQEASYKRKLLIQEVNGYINSSKRILESKFNQNFS